MKSISNQQISQSNHDQQGKLLFTDFVFHANGERWNHNSHKFQSPPITNWVEKKSNNNSPNGVPSKFVKYECRLVSLKKFNTQPFQIWWSTYGSNVSESRDLNQVRKERHCLETNMMMIFNLSSPQNTFLKKRTISCGKSLSLKLSILLIWSYLGCGENAHVPTSL